LLYDTSIQLVGYTGCSNVYSKLVELNYECT